ncbi:MAG: ABC transporter substrate-binding protein [Chloroflexota bacterium]|nr:ABC transporter substrate-binding protein [Chloroflexota bacterium]MDE2885877.1 ABC transporter substrate-binding protein [Chloroflexota bacterium]
MATFTSTAARAALVCALLLGLVAACGDGSQGASAAPTLKLGLLLDFSEGSTEKARDREQAFNLAVKHVNAAGGVLGRPIETVTRDSTRDPVVAVEEARRMIEEDGIHVLVGPNTSANSLPVAEQVAGPAGIPVISPSASSPLLTDAADNDFYFRAALSDIAQGPVLAQVTRDRGFTNVGVVYLDDFWGRGIYESFAAAWTGALRAVSVPPGQTTFLSELRETANGGAAALVVLTFEAEAEVIVREAVESGLYERFILGGALKSPTLGAAVGGALAGAYGTAGAAAPESAALAEWDAAFVAEYGKPPEYAYVRETYDATIALALAAQAAGSVDGTAIRDQLRSIGSGPGTTIAPTAAGVAEALRILDEGGAVDYEGAATAMDWDGNGDLRSGHIGVWRFTQDGRIEDLHTVRFDY